MVIFEKMAEKGLTSITVLPSDPVIEAATWIAVKTKKEGYQYQRIFNYLPAGPQGMISIHSLTLGPALGGIRAPENYYKDEEDLFLDAMRLSPTMTTKVSLAGLNLGGGKCALWRDENTKVDLGYLKNLAQEINALKGDYIAAEDMGWKANMLMAMHSFTPYVVGLPYTFNYWRSSKLCTGSGDPGKMTALGLVTGWKMCMKFLKLDKPEEVSVAIQGLGSVGKPAAHIAYEHGFRKFFFSEKDFESAKEFAEGFAMAHFYQVETKAVEAEEIYDAPCTIFAPCAGSGVLTEDRAKRLAKAGCKISAGSANNVLSDLSVAQTLMDLRVLHVHDPVIGSGGVINAEDELHGYKMDRAKKNVVETITKNVADVISLASIVRKPTPVVAQALADLRLGQKEYEVLSLADRFGKGRKEIFKILAKKETLVNDLLTN